MGSWRGYYPEDYSAEEYWAQDYWPDPSGPQIPTGIGLGTTPAINGTCVGFHEDDTAGGVWWWVLPKDLQIAFGFIAADPPAPKIIEELPRVAKGKGAAPVVKEAVPAVQGTGQAPVILPPIVVPAPLRRVGRVKAAVGALWDRIIGKAHLVVTGRGLGQQGAVTGHGQANVGVVARADAQIPQISGISQADYTVAGDEEFMELMGNVLLKIDAPDISEQEAEELLVMAQLANEYFNGSPL